jgi:hypothetical protein
VALRSNQERASSRDSESASAPGRWLRLPLVIVAIAVAIVVLPRLGVVGDDRERAFLVDPAYVELASGPAWMSGSVAESVRAALAELEPTPLRRDDEVTALTEAIAASTGWVRSIDRIEKRYPNRLEVEVTLREPVALVETEHGLVLVDGDAVVVADAADSAEYLADHPLPLLRASRPLRVARPGQKVKDLALDEGLRVAAEIAPYRADLANRGLDLDVIDLTPKERSGGTSLTDVELYTRNGLAIEWGRSRAHPKFGALEPSADAKVRGLLRVAARYPELAGIERVRLQFADPTVLFEEGSSVSRGGP